MEVSRTDRWPGITDRVDKPMSSAVAFMHGHVGSPAPSADIEAFSSSQWVPGTKRSLQIVSVITVITE